MKTFPGSGGPVLRWKASVPRIKAFCYFDTEREAAIYVDKKLILAGKEPINILKRAPEK